MRAWEVGFKSGLVQVYYGPTQEEALACVEDIDEVVSIVDVLRNIKCQKEFKQEHEPFLRSVHVLGEMQKAKAQKESFERLKSENLLPPQPGGSGLLQPGSGVFHG